MPLIPLSSTLPTLFIETLTLLGSVLKLTQTTTSLTNCLPPYYRMVPGSSFPSLVATEQRLFGGNDTVSTKVFISGGNFIFYTLCLEHEAITISSGDYNHSFSPGVNHPPTLLVYLLIDLFNHSLLCLKLSSNSISFSLFF